MSVSCRRHRYSRSDTEGIMDRRGRMTDLQMLTARQMAYLLHS